MAPDNGVLTAVLQETPAKKVVELTERRYARPTVSRTFEGRDRFAPAAAWLSKGVQLTALGRPVSDFVLLELPKPRLDDAVLHGVVIRIDHFGNVVTNLDRRSCERLADGGGVLRLTVGGPRDWPYRVDVLRARARRDRRALRQHRSARVRLERVTRRRSTRRRVGAPVELRRL